MMKSNDPVVLPEKDSAPFSSPILQEVDEKSNLMSVLSNTERDVARNDLDEMSQTVEFLQHFKDLLPTELRDIGDQFSQFRDVVEHSNDPNELFDAVGRLKNICDTVSSLDSNVEFQVNLH